MTVTNDDVTQWAQRTDAPTSDPEAGILTRLLTAVTERAVDTFGLNADPAQWSELENQAVIEVTAEQWLAARNTAYGAGGLDDGPTIQAQSIAVGLKRRLPPAIAGAVF